MNLVLANKIPEYIFTDRMRLRKILIDILSNAVKFTDRGGVSLILDYSPSSAVSDSSNISFAVKDSGVVVPKEFRANLFMPFSQADVDDNMRRSGTGLSLDLSRRLARTMGGDLTYAENPTGVGSTFHDHRWNGLSGRSQFLGCFEK